MNIERLYKILDECSVQLRKGEEIIQHGNVTEIFAMPHESEVNNLEKIDCHFIVVGVEKATTEKYRQELIDILNEYPNMERLKGGPSYIEVGAEIGDQGMAFKLFAAGQVLGFWQVMTPARMGITGPMADQMAGQGFVLITGYKPDAKNNL